MAKLEFLGAYIQGAIMPPPALEVAWEGYRKFLEGSANAPEAANGKVKENGQGKIKAQGGQGVVKEGLRKFLEGAAKTPQAANGKVNKSNSMEEISSADNCSKQRKDKAMPVEMIDMMRGSEFWREGCERMRASVCELLQLAGKSVTLANVLRIVESLPKNRSHAVPEEWREKSYCSDCFQ